MRELRADSEQQRRDANRVGIGQLRQVAGAHQHFRVGQVRAHLAIARERLGEAEMDGIDDRVEDGAEASLLRLFSGAIKRGEIAVLRPESTPAARRSLRRSRDCAR